MMLIRKNSASIVVYLSARSTNFTVFSSPHFLTPLSLFTSGADDPPPQTPFIIKFLINSVGLSSEEAAKASKSITHIKFPSQPDSVLDFFRKNGFTDTRIKRIVSLSSKVLCANVDSNLKLKFDALRKLGFTETQIIKLITANPFVLNYLNYHNVRPRVEFLRGLLGSNDGIVNAFSNDTSLLSCDLEKTIKPSIAFLRECQISDERICSSLTKDKRIIGRNLSFLRSVAMRVIKLGVPCESGMFYIAFRCLCNVDSDTVVAKSKFLGSLGFSKAEVVSMMSRHPAILNLSEKNLRETVDFLVKEGGCTLSYLCQHPSIMDLSLTRRLIPRNYVMQLIREKGLLKKEKDFYYIVSIPERKFLEKFICSFQKKNMPDLTDVYLSATAESVAIPGRSAPFIIATSDPEFLATRLYQNCSLEDLSLAKMMVRPTSFFQEDLSKRAAFSEERYGSVDKVFVLCGEDAALTPDYQRWMMENSPVKEVMEINGADHMPMLSKPRELCQCIAAIANSYIR